jgi:hypothetical protein
MLHAIGFVVRIQMQRDIPSPLLCLSTAVDM